MRTIQRLVSLHAPRKHAPLAAALLAGALALGLPAPGARAQTAPGADELRLDPVTVTATRTPRRLSTVGDSIEIITKEQIEDLLPGDFVEVLRDVTGGVVEQIGSRGGNVNLRIRGSENNFTSVLIDGFKVVPPSGVPFDLGHLSPEWIARAELLRGPQSTLYGSDAAAGVLNLLPDVGRPGEARSAEASVRYGSFSTWEESVKVKGGTERAGYLGTLSRVDTDGRFRNDGYYRTVATFAFDLFASERTKLRLLYNFNTNRFDNTSNSGATNTDLRLAAPFTDRELNFFQRITDQLWGVRMEVRAAPWLEYIPRISYFERQELVQDKPDLLDAARPFFSPFRADRTHTRLNLDNQFNLRFSDKRRRGTSSVTTVGFEYEDERFFEQQINSTTNRRRLARSVYAQEQLSLPGGLTLTAGVRVDNFDVGEDETTTKVSAAYRLRATGTKIRGAYGTGVKRPAFSDLFGILSFTGNPNLSSERQENWEGGVDQELWGRRLRLSATYFQSEIKDLIAFSFSGFPNGTNFENISKARLKGGEFSLVLRDVHGFTVRANYNTLDTIVLDDRGGLGGSSFVQGEELLRRPNWWWSGSVSYHPGRLRATARVNQVGRRRDLDFRPFVDGSNGGAARGVNNPGHTKIDLALAYDIIRDGRSIFAPGRPAPVRRLTAELKLNNLLDEDYDEVFGFNAPGFQWFAGFRLRF